MTERQITDVELHDSVMEYVHLTVSGAAVIRLRSLHVTIENDEWDCAASLTCEGLRRFEIDSALPADGWIYDCSFVRGGGDELSFSELLTGAAMTRLEIKLHNGAYVRIECASAILRVDEETIGRQRWGGAP